LSVYTALNHAQIESFISAYKLKPLISYAGITAGIENTNYLLKTAQGDYVLTLYEQFNVDEISPYLSLLKQLGRHEKYYPSPLTDIRQKHLNILQNKPATLFKCLPGKSVEQATLLQCQLVASSLAKFHCTSPSLDFNNKNPRNFDWIQATALQLTSQLSAADSILLADELNYQLKYTTQHLTQGIIHADLFKDNVLFVENRLTGLLDFYAACFDYFLLDIAITLNDWCVDQQGVFIRKQQEAFMQAYKHVRDISKQEEKLLPLLLRRACLRFWLSRLQHKFNPRAGEITQEKDPDFFKNLLLQHRHYYPKNIS